VTGETFQLDGSIPIFADDPAKAWAPFDVRPGYNVYRSTLAYPLAGVYGGLIGIDGQWLPLATHPTPDWLRARTDIWFDQPFYMGPGITSAADGHLIARLDNGTPEAQCNRLVAQVTDPDPRHHALRISQPGQFGLTIAGSHHVFEGFTIHNYYGAFVMSGPVSDITLRGIGGRVNRFGGRLGQSSQVLIQNPAFDGCMNPEKWWVSWIDVKGANTPASGVRKCGLDYGVSNHVEVTGGYFHDFFDAALSEGAHDVQVHGVEFRTWDDAWQMYGSLYRIEQHHNLYIGAGPSRDGSGTDAPNPAPGTLWIHDNIIDTTRYRLFYFRFGRAEDPTGIGWREPIPLSAHKTPTTGERTIPWKFYNNTIVTGITSLPVLSYVGIGQFGDANAIVEARHEVYNNVILVQDGRPLGRDTWVNTGAEIYDGNVYWGWRNPSSSGYTSIWRFLHRSAGLVDGENPPASIGDVDKLRSLARDDSKKYYAPGWEAAGIEADPQLDSQYRPPHNSILATGAVDLTNTSWPGTSVYRPWRGAVAP
jgi:hypothetical protein